MANLSKQKRDIMLNFLKELKDEHKDDIEKWTVISEIENALEEKKYGLVWEQHEELLDIIIKDNIPVFTEIKENEISMLPNKKYNFLIEGDNLHSLMLLERTHKKRINVIYIDPPYNTHNSLTYDDSRVGVDDYFRHSKWLSFMEKRLKIAYELLRDDGLIMLSIDDNEGYQLKLLMDEIFGEENLMGVFAVIKAEGGGMAKHVVKGHDLLLVYAKDLTKAKPLAKEKDIRGKRITIDNIEYWIQEDAIRETFGQYGNLYYEDVLEKKGKEYKDKIDQGIASHEYILVPKENGKNIIGKLRRLDEDYSKFHSVIKHLNAEGVNSLKALGLSDDFDYPKPVSLLKELIRGATFFSNETAIILDFFAGSGTTAQAVLELNNEDGKDRQFILCTNNELSAKAKLKFVQSFGYLLDYHPTTNTDDNAIENKIYSVFENGKDGFQELVNNNIEKYESYGICKAVTRVRLKKIIEGYDSAAPEQIILFDKKLTPKNISNSSSFLQKIDSYIEAGEYDDYNVKITNDCHLQLVASNGIYKHHKGIPANLKYYSTAYVSKAEEYLSDALTEHIKEMIQLENGTNMDDKEYLLILNDDEADSLESHWSDYDCIKGIYISRNVLLTSSQNALFNKVPIYTIPDKFFNFEMKEVGESW